MTMLATLLLLVVSTATPDFPDAQAGPTGSTAATQPAPPEKKADPPPSATGTPATWGPTGPAGSTGPTGLTAATGTGSTGATTPAAPGPTTATQTQPRAGQGLPPLSLRATANASPAHVQLTLDADSVPDDLSAGLLVNPQQPDLRIVPTLTLQTDLKGRKGLTNVDLQVHGLMPFGDMTVPLLYRGRQVETLRFLKAGLSARPPAEGPMIAREDDGLLLLVLENPSTEEYGRVGIRVRFQDVDVCNATGDQPTTRRAGQPTAESGWWPWAIARAGRLFEAPRVQRPVICSPVTEWASFHVRPSSQASLWVPTPPEWYVDRQSGLARSATRRGLVTLRFFDDAGTTVAAEQNVPVDVRFEPTTYNLSWSIGWIAFLLLCGALLFLLLRVSIPNYRRKKGLKDQLNEARTATAMVSNLVDSQLRVLVRVERLVLDQRRREGWVLLPGFDELARRVDAGLATLTRKIGFVQRLDTIACRREALVDGPVAPTRLDNLDRDTSDACEALKADQLGDAEWLFIKERLDAADKMLNAPTPAEIQAFQALLAQRWQTLRDHFGFTPDPTGTTIELHVPQELSVMAPCFPRGALLPRNDDDGAKWVASVGVVRADLQLTALEMVRDVQFLAPREATPQWVDDMQTLTPWLATPAIPNLWEARRLLRQIAEGVKVADVLKAIVEGKADIEMDPQVVGPNQTVRLGIRFRDPRINAATARAAIQCEWIFEEAVMEEFGSRLASFWPRTTKLVRYILDHLGLTDEPPRAVEQTERGWRVYRYFEPGVKEQKISLRFFHEGVLVALSPEAHEAFCKLVHPAERTVSKKESREKWLRFAFQTVQMLAALLVPLATLAITTAGEPSSGRWWDLVGIGFGSEAIRNILTGEPPPPTT